MSPKQTPSLASLAVATMLALGGLAHGGFAHAADNLTLGGFGTLGLAHVDGGGANFIRDVTQRKGADNRGLSADLDSRLGIQLNYRPADNLELVAQAISRLRSENNFAPQVSLGFVRYSINGAFELRAGRIGFDAYHGADSRDIGYSYLWLRPPVDYYANLYVSHRDGVDTILRTPIAHGNARLKLFAGRARGEASSLLEQRLWAGNIPASVGSTQDLDGSHIFGAYVDYHDQRWLVRLGAARIRIENMHTTSQLNTFGFLRNTARQATRQGNVALGNALTAFADDAMAIDKAVNYRSLEATYEDGPLQLQIATNRMTSDSLLAGNTRAGYLSLGYRFGRFMPYGVVSGVNTRRSTRADELAPIAPANIASLANFLVSAPLTNQHTHTLGLRHDFADKLAIKYQLDFIHNRNCSPVSLPIIGPTASCAPPRYWARVPTNWNGRATVLAVGLDFVF